MTVISKDLEAKAIQWGTWMGENMASRQWRQHFPYFSTAEVTLNAQVSASNEALEYKVPAEAYSQWEQIFIGQYTDAYTAKVAERETHEIARQAQIVRK